MIVPNLIFNGECQEALEFYQEAFSCEAEVIRYADVPGKKIPPQMLNHIMRATLTFAGKTLYLSDSLQEDKQVPGNRIALNISFHFSDDVQQAFDTLAYGGRIVEALGESAQSPLYGCVVDKYGVCWHILYD